MKIIVSNGVHQRNIELLLSDSKLSGVMRSQGVTSVIPYSALNAVWEDSKLARKINSEEDQSRSFGR